MSVLLTMEGVLKIASMWRGVMSVPARPGSSWEETTGLVWMSTNAQLHHASKLVSISPEVFTVNVSLDTH